MTPWRKLLYKELETVTLTGNVLDLGGSRKSGYHELIKGTPTFEVVNIDDLYGYDHKFDLEQPFPLADSTYDAVLAINVLEHIFNHKSFLSESRRVLKTSGTFVIGVPFLMFVHPSPHDHWRYTGETLTRLLKEVGFTHIEVRPVGRGPGAVFTQLVGGLRGGRVLRRIVAPGMWVFDACASLVMSKQELIERFPLGYVIQAVK